MSRTVTVNPGFVSAITEDGEPVLVDGQPLTLTADATHSTNVTIAAGLSTNVTVEES